MSDEECLEIHQFLCIIAQPVLVCPIDAEDSIAGILAVRDIGIAITARKDGHLIGTIGLIQAEWWYNSKIKFFTDRWNFVIPTFFHQGVGTKMLAAAAVIASQANMDIVINGHLRHSAKGIGRGVHFTRTRLIHPGDKVN